VDSRQQFAHTFGDRLRREREMRGVSLDEIAERTKIGTRLLKALEDEQFELLPGGIFNKGFVRAYANYLGMDEEQAVAEYLQAAGQAEPDVQLIAQQSDRGESWVRESASSAPRGFPFLPVLLLLVVVVGGFGGWKLYQQHMAELEASRTERQASAATQPATPQPANAAPDTVRHDVAQSSKPEPPSPTPAATPASPSEQTLPAAEKNSSAAAAGFDVVVRTKGRAWVSLKADGKYLVRGILDADQVRTLHANQEIVVWTGNAGMTEVAFQGKAVPTEGGPNEAWVLVFTPEGLKPSRQPVTTPGVQTPAQPTEQQPAPPSPQQLPSPQ
jgi:cytoskeleton protein RodZ